MTIALISLTFQGEPTVVGSLDPDTLRTAQREAFPRSPRRDALSDPTYCACKCAPLRTGQLLFSVTRNPGTTDAHGRPALQANAAVLDRTDLTTAARDPVAIWQALKEWSTGKTEEAFLETTRRHSSWDSDAIFARAQAALSQEPGFLAGAAAALATGKATIGSAAEDVLEVLRPAFMMLPVGRLFALELATGSIDGEGREGCVVTAQHVEVPEEHGGLLGGFLKRKGVAPTVDLRARKATGAGEGPLELAKAIGSTQEWPGITGRERFRILMGGLDTAASPFDMSPQLQAMRATVHQVEKLTHDLEGWR